ncbi:MAG: aminotransferase class I/II-fold pyridoxal phosphate-dependent enzyme [Candidatus Roizmanbacteria bacterium]
MPKQSFFSVLDSEVERIDGVKTSKRHERIIQSFKSPTVAQIDGKDVLIFNSNDYLGLRHNKQVKESEHAASTKYGAGPGAVRFISGSMQIHRDLEKTVAAFHGRDDAMVFSSAFAANLAVLYCLISGQNKDSKVTSDVLVVSDALNHRSIIDGIRLANLPKESRAVFEHMNMASLDEILAANKGKFSRVLVVTDGVFSMLGEYQKLDEMKTVIDKYDAEYPQGVLLVMDDCHGVASCSDDGRGVEGLKKSKADVLVGTFGKGFGSDGGYVVANQQVIDYLRESSATYIYSNSIPPGTAGAALQAVKIVDSPEGKQLLKTSQSNTAYFKKLMKEAGFVFAAESTHPIQPVLIGDPVKTRSLVDFLFSKNILVTNISYPVVPKGRDEIRVQISATHTKGEIEYLVKSMKEFRG